jgi:hypothetical protein
VQGRAWHEEIPHASFVSLAFPLPPKLCIRVLACCSREKLKCCEGCGGSFCRDSCVCEGEALVGFFEVKATTGDTHLGGEDFDKHGLSQVPAPERGINVLAKSSPLTPRRSALLRPERPLIPAQPKETHRFPSRRPDCHSCVKTRIALGEKD